MTVVVSMLRAVNVGGHNKIKMEDLKALYSSLKFLDVETFIQSGNVVFRSKEPDVSSIAKRIENAIDRKFAMRPQVIVRTCSELRDVVARNPFAMRTDIHPSRLLVTFLSVEPDAEARTKVLRMKTDPEELRIDGRELFVHFPNGMAKPKIPMTLIEKALKTPGTGRNWNTVKKLLEMAEKLEAGVVG